jgi:hypothetical protein
MTQDNLGVTLAAIGELEHNPSHLEGAVSCFRAALQEKTRERVPHDWAGTQANLGHALSTLGEWEGGTAKLEEAVVAYRAALLEWKRELVPLDWANCAGSLGATLVVIAERNSDCSVATTAVSLIEAALETARSGGHLPLADYLATALETGQALAARLSATER